MTEFVHPMYRLICTDGRKVRVDSSPQYYGYSVGRWEDDNDGNPYSDDLRVTERLKRLDFGTMELG